MTNRITGSEYPLAKIFSADFDFAIPTYQRPYAWTNDQAGELFDDLYGFFESEKDDTYFLGSIVLIKQENQPRAEVIDGQQRLTSLTILLAALASVLTDPESSEDFCNYVCEPGRKSLNLLPKPRLALRDQDKAFFSKYLQSRGNLPELLKLNAAQLKNEAQQNIQANTRLFLERLEKRFNSDQKRLMAFGHFIVTRCFLVAVTTPSQQSAFRVFSVLNSRGLDLLPTDIIKSKVIGEIAEHHREAYNKKWEEIEIQTTREGMVELFGHLRMIYAKTKARASLLQEFDESVRPKYSGAETLIDELIEPYADAFLIAKHGTYKASSKSDADAVNTMIGWLNRIDNVDWIPVAIRLLAQKKEDPTYVRWFFERLERLAAYMHITAHNVNERIERYAQVLRSLENDHSNLARATAVDLREGEKKSFRSALDGRIYELNPRRRNYVILRLDAFHSDGAAAYNTDVLTIEHVLPQTIDKGSAWETTWPDVAERAKWVHRIGNLVPLARRTNSSASNLAFKDKCEKYFAGKAGVSSYALTTQVLKSADWLPSTVEARQQKLLDKFSTCWDLY